MIGPEVRLQGDVRGKTNLEIQGDMEGVAEIEGLVVLRKNGRLKGEIRAIGAIVEGTMEGSIETRDKVELGATARVKGEIKTRTVAIAEGSFFQGKVYMADERRGQGELSFSEKRGKSG